jgi:hypothetical protein
MCAVNNAVNTDNVAVEAEQCCPTHIGADNMKHNLGLRVKCSIFFGHISTKSPTSIFMKIRPVGVVLMDADKRIDMAILTGAFREGA